MALYRRDAFLLLVGYWCVAVSCIALSAFAERQLQGDDDDPVNNWCSGTSTYNGYGTAAVISGDGTVIAIRSLGRNDDLPSPVSFISLNDTSLFQFGTSEGIQGVSDDDFSGRSMALSRDGRTIAVAFSGVVATGVNVTCSDSENVTESSKSGYIQVYQHDSPTDSWLPLDGALMGEKGEQYGLSVSLSGDGSIVAIGAEQHDGSKGRVRVYQFLGNVSGWVQLGNDIKGTRRGDLCGNSVSLSENGQTVAVLVAGVPIVKVFRNSFSGTNGWVQLGDDIEINGTNSNGISIGRSVSLSADGLTVATGSLFAWDEIPFAAFVFTLSNNDEWVRLGNPMGRGYNGFATSLSTMGEPLPLAQFGPLKMQAMFDSIDTIRFWKTG